MVFRSNNQSYCFKRIPGRQERVTRLWRKTELSSEASSAILAETGQVTFPIISFLICRMEVMTEQARSIMGGLD